MADFCHPVQAHCCPGFYQNLNEALTKLPRHPQPDCTTARWSDIRDNYQLVIPNQVEDDDNVLFLDGY